MKRIARNKHPTKQKIDKRFVQNLKKYVTELEDCVQSQQKTIEELRSEIANNALAYQIKDKRYNDMLKYCELNRPEILQLMKTFAKHGVLAAQGKVKPIEVVLMKAKRKAPKIPEFPAEVKQPTLEEAKALRDQFYQQFPEVKKVLENVQKEVVAMTDAATAAMKLNPITIIDPKHTPKPIADEPTGLREIWNPKTRKFEKEKPQ